jgi:hypothetical protein
VVLYGCETWSLTVREEHKLRVFENRVLRRIFGPMRNTVMGGWRKLHNDMWVMGPEWGRRGTCIGYWQKSQRERDH